MFQEFLEETVSTKMLYMMSAMSLKLNNIY